MKWWSVMYHGRFHGFEGVVEALLVKLHEQGTYGCLLDWQLVKNVIILIICWFNFGKDSWLVMPVLSHWATTTGHKLFTFSCIFHLKTSKHHACFMCLELQQHNCLRIALHFDFREGCVEHDWAKGLPRSGKRPTPQVIFSNKKTSAYTLELLLF